MSINVLIFVDGIRPDENWLGLVQISQRAEIVNNIILIGEFNDKHRDLLSPKVILKSQIKISDVSRCHLVFGLPARYGFLKIINLFKRKNIYLGVVPGKITKAIGQYKHPNKSIKGKILRYFRSLIPHNYCLAQDFEDAMYLATAYGRDIDCHLPIGLPKNVHIALEFAKDKDDEKIGILFVPTHRWQGKKSVIAEWLADEDFVKHLKNYNIFYNNHPEEVDSEVSSLVVKTRKLQNPFWKNVDILVTDYSSIAHDFLLAGGSKVIHITSDLIDFENHQGKSPLPYSRQFPGIKCNTKDEFINVITKMKDFERKIFDIEVYSNQWIEKILNQN